MVRKEPLHPGAQPLLTVIDGRAVRDAIRQLLSGAVTSQVRLVEQSSKWTLGAIRQLLAVVLERDPLGAVGPATRTLLERDRGGVLAALVAHRRTDTRIGAG